MFAGDVQGLDALALNVPLATAHDLEEDLRKARGQELVRLRSLALHETRRILVG